MKLQLNANLSPLFSDHLVREISPSLYPLPPMALGDPPGKGMDGLPSQVCNIPLL
jgi:hypothetical protein